MRVLILSQYYWPEPIPKPGELAEALQRVGDDVTVITGLPNYPTGRLYPSHRLRLISRESVNGIRVVRTFEFPYHGTRALGRIANYLSFMLSAPLGLIFAPKVDVIYVWHPPLTVGVAAWMIARIRKIPFVYDVQDIWPEAAVLSGILQPGRIVGWLSRLERFVYRRADHLLTVTEGARKNLISKGISPNKISVMPHWFDEKVFPAEAAASRDGVRREYGWGDRFVVLFAGNHGLVQGLDTVVRAVERLPEKAPITVVFVGDGADKPRLEELVRTLRLNGRIQFLERQPMAKMPRLMAAADCLLVHLKHSELSNYVIPTKTLAYLAGSQPILMAMWGAAADLVQEAGAGLVIEPENPIALAEGMVALAAMSAEERMKMGRSGRDYLERHLSREVVLPRYRALLAGLMRAKSSS